MFGSGNSSLQGIIGWFALRMWTVLLAVIVPATAFSDEMANRILAEAPKAWRAWEGFAFQCKGTVEQTFEVEKRTTEVYVYHFNGKGGDFCCESHSPNFEVEAFNLSYGFWLSKVSAESPWSIKDYDSSNKIQELILEDCKFLAVGDMVYQQSLRWIMAQPTFKIQSLESLTDSKKDLVRVHFDCRARGRYEVDGGWVDLDSTRSWALTEFELKLRFDDGPGILHGWTEYSGILGGFPIPVRHVMEIRKDVNTPVLVRRTITFKDYAAGDITERECQLSAFGLPEPGSSVLPSRQLWLTLSIVSLLVLLAIYFRGRAMRFVKQKESTVNLNDPKVS